MKRDLKLITEAYKKVNVVKPKLTVPDPDGEWINWLNKFRHIVHDDGSVSITHDFYDSDHTYEHLPVIIKTVVGGISLSNLKKLKTLEGLPSDVDGLFYLSNLPALNSLEGGPTLVEDSVRITFLNQLQSLKGAPTTVMGNFGLHRLKSLQSLDGSPTHVGRNYVCGSCPNIKSLKGVPTTVMGNFDLHHLESLQSLEGSPTHVGMDYICSGCPNIKSLKGLTPGCKSYFIDGFTQEQIDDYFTGLELKDTATGDPTFDDFFGIGGD